MSDRLHEKDAPLADGAVEVQLSGPELLGKGFREYVRYRYALPGDDPQCGARTHDLIRFGHIVGVLPVDLARNEVVLIRQFRLPVHVTNGKGELVEIVAGHVEPGEDPAEAARRECLEEIAVAPAALAELFTYFPTPGASDERITLFLGIVDAAKVPNRAGSADEREETHPFRVSIDAALAAMANGSMHNGLLLMALHWLALNRGRLAAVAERGAL